MNAVNTSVMGTNIRAMPWLHNKHDLILLTLRWHSFSWEGNEAITHCYTWNDGNYFIYKSLPQRNTSITKDATSNIIDTLLTLIFRMGQEAFRISICPWRQPIQHLWMSATSRHLDDPRWKATNCLCSVDTHLQNVAVTMSLLLLPIQAGNAFNIYNHYNITF